MMLYFGLAIQIEYIVVSYVGTHTSYIKNILLYLMWVLIHHISKAGRKRYFSDIRTRFNNKLTKHC